MAYVLGYWYADGSMYPSVRGSYLNVTSIDEDTIIKIKGWLSSDHTITTRESTWPNGKIRFVLRIGNKNLYNSLLRLGLYPSKSLTVQLPNIPSKFLGHFARGYFDGDGCISLYKVRGITQDTIIKKLSVIFTSGSPDFLASLCKILAEKLFLDQRKVYRGHRCFQLRYSTGDSVKLFKLLYGDCIKKEKLYLERKFRVFDNYFRLRPKRIDIKIKHILVNLR